MKAYIPSSHYPPVIPIPKTSALLIAGTGSGVGKTTKEELGKCVEFGRSFAAKMKGGIEFQNIRKVLSGWVVEELR